ncbi:MAG: hypothetical protein GC189_00165 [Alphaproteobacteria bacterium]|nr:hypothetical protein [Alphaproteobacteria bacterium]
MKRLALAAALMLLAACASTPVYAPAARAGGTGYSEQRIETNRWRVIYRGGQGANPALVADFALLRAADLTVLSGNDWFVVDRRDAEVEPGSRGPSVSVGLGGGNYGRRSGVGVGVGVGFPLGGGQSGPSELLLEIRMGRGPAPEVPNAYNARDVAQSIRARLNAPPAQV